MTLRGKNEPSFEPHIAPDVTVTVNNTSKLKLSSTQLGEEYTRYSGYPGGQKATNAQELMDKKPIAIIEKAVKGMLPKNSLGRDMYRKLFVYDGPDHPHAAQKPEAFKF